LLIEGDTYESSKIDIRFSKILFFAISIKTFFISYCFFSFFQCLRKIKKRLKKENIFFLLISNHFFHMLSNFHRQDQQLLFPFFLLYLHFLNSNKKSIISYLFIILTYVSSFFSNCIGADVVDPLPKELAINPAPCTAVPGRR
jgi:hypothetical protein